MAEYLDAAEGQRAVLDGYGLTDAHVAAAREALAAAGTAASAWTVADKEAEDATRMRDAEMVPLDRAMRDLQERGRGGMADRPDLLGLPRGEGNGPRPPSGPRPSSGLTTPRTPRLSTCV